MPSLSVVLLFSDIKVTELKKGIAKFLEGGGSKISGRLEVSPEPFGPFLFLAPIVAACILPNRPLFFETLAQANFDKGQGNGAIQS